MHNQLPYDKWNKFSKHENSKLQMLKRDHELQWSSWHCHDEKTFVEWAPHKFGALQSSIKCELKSRWSTKNKETKRNFAFNNYKFGLKTHFKKCDTTQIQFVMNMVLAIAKDCIKLLIIGSFELWQLVLHCDPNITFPFHKNLSNPTLTHDVGENNGMFHSFNNYYLTLAWASLLIYRCITFICLC
jgi:hypothetical protein